MRDFARPGKPLANWSLRRVQGVWDRDRRPFAKAGWDAIVVNPANFIQYQSPSAAYDGDNPDGASPLTALLGVIDAHGVAPIYLYEGWAEMSSGFPLPSASSAGTTHLTRAIIMLGMRRLYQRFAAHGQR
ncbi:hypothetical protein N4R57_06685 [Rhodobacteraceae bacterium D3-12]|nr:hypothetical protein N4R57_06685 [Rhodobacteraceae bacterium D3-12]